MTLTQDGEKVTLPGIYHLEGDVLRICFATSVEKERPGDRPKEFKTTADTGLVVILATLKRVPPIKEEEPPKKTAAAEPEPKKEAPQEPKPFAVTGKVSSLAWGRDGLA